MHLFPKAIWADLFENHVLGGAPRRKLTRPAEVVYFERAVKQPGRASRRAFPSVVSPIYLLRSFMYWRLPPFADAVVTVAPRESDGLLVARIAKGRARKPRCMLWAPVRHWHTIAVAALGVAYALYGWPRSRSNDSSYRDDDFPITVEHVVMSDDIRVACIPRVGCTRRYSHCSIVIHDVI